LPQIGVVLAAFLVAGWGNGAQGRLEEGYYAKMRSGLKKQRLNANESDAQETAALLKTIENQGCVNDLMRPASPYSRSRTGRMVPRVG
jgi:hypothetical protein